MSSGQTLKFDRVLVTGAGGFLGRHVVARLAPLSEAVVLASRSVPADFAGRAISIDLTEPGAIRHVLRDVRPTTVLNLAGRRPLAAGENPTKTIELNLLSAVEIVKESAEQGVGRIVLVGSAEEYGDQAMPVGEDAPMRPRSIYGASKAAMTLHALALHQTIHAPVVVVRPFSVYGPGAPLHMFVAEALDCASRGVPFEMTDGVQRRDLIHVTDVVDGLLAAATVPGVAGEVFNLGSGTTHALRDVAKTLWRISETTAELRIGARSKAPWDLDETRANIDKAREILGWQPRVSLEDGLRSTWAAMRKREAGEA